MNGYSTVENEIVVYENWKVYCHRCRDNGKMYFGITSKTFNERFGSNGIKYKNKNKDKPTHFENAINKHGWDSFDHIFICENLTRKMSFEIEKALIAYYKSNNRKYGYNMTGGGEGSLGLHPSEETRRKISISGMRDNLSPETRRKLSESHKRENLSPELIERMRENALNNTSIGFIKKGDKHTEETKIKMCEAQKYRSKKLICLNTLESFDNARILADIFGIHKKSFCNCARGKSKSSGTHPVTGEKLKWMYLEDYNKLTEQEKEEIRTSEYTGSFLLQEIKEAI